MQSCTADFGKLMHIIKTLKDGNSEQYKKIRLKKKNVIEMI
jgi:hypothetical protein